MTFISAKFLIFIIFFLLIYKLTERLPKVQNGILLLGNYIFYALINYKFTIVLLFVSLFTCGISRGIVKAGPKKVLLVLGIILNVFILLFFKYIGLFTDISSKYGLVMPIGLSFYVFEAISLIADSYTGKMTEKASVLDTLIYLSFFPIIISGPIEKARDFIPQIHKTRQLSLEQFEPGIQRFVLGMFEKLVIADRLGAAVDAVYSAPAAYSGISLLWNSLSFSLQLFFDFAGYTNMAVGIATVLGFHINENFNLPYIATSPTDFWKRWHISLSSWITEYIYIPLGGNRKGKTRTSINIMIAMLISGLWHGSTLNYLIWGAGHGLAQIIQKRCVGITKNEGGKPSFFSKAVSIILTFVLIDLLWIPFRTPDIATTILVFQRIITNACGLTYIYSWTLIFAVVLIIVEIYATIKNNANNPIKPLALRSFTGKLIFITMILLTFMFAYFGNSAFIYEAF